MNAIANNCQDNNTTDCWNLVWCDDFDGNSLDNTKWIQRLDGQGNPYNPTTQHCVDNSNVKVENGTVVITGKKQTIVCPNISNNNVNQTYNYTTGNIDTRGRFSQQYGRYEARIKFPKVKGFWGGFWISPIQGSWPSGGEVDIAEYWGGYPDEIGTAIWYGESANNPKKNDDKYIYPAGSSADQFHLYALEWEPEELRFYINDVLIRTITKAETIADGSNWPFDSEEFYLRLTMDVGSNGTWGGSPINNGSEFPVEMLVDYVKVYENISNCIPITSCNLVQNGTFDNGTSNWETYKHSSINADLSINNNGNATYAIYNGSNAYWKLQLLQRGLNLQQGITYRVKFKARASYNRNIQVSGSNNSDNTEYFKEIIGIKTSWDDYEFEFTMNNANDANSRLNFRLGGNSNLYVYIDDVILEAVDCGEAGPDCSELVSNGNFDVNTNDFELGQFGGASGNWFWRHSGGQYAHIDINNGGNANWKTQLIQHGISLVEGRDYIITFSAKADFTKDVFVETTNTAGANYSGGSVNIETTWQSYSIPFTMNASTDNNARLNFHLGGANNKIRFDDISIKEAACLNNRQRIGTETPLFDTNLDILVNNPIEDFVNIRINESNASSGEIYIYDLQGRLLIQKPFDNQYQITVPTRNLDNGVYILKVRAGFKQYSSKLLKQ